MTMIGIRVRTRAIHAVPSGEGDASRRRLLGR